MASIIRGLWGPVSGNAEDLVIRTQLLSAVEIGKGSAIILMAASVAGIALGLIFMMGSFLATIFGGLLLTLSLIGFFTLRDVFLILSHLGNEIDRNPGPYIRNFPRPPRGEISDRSIEEMAERLLNLLKQVPKWLKTSAEATPTRILTPAALSILDYWVTVKIDAAASEQQAAREQRR